ncbi:MAG: Tripartite-type tricarboxylate transporter, receptor component TctC [Rhizobacter sp.]|nr:Tripartite-type tricarboxylate transporter, receptor component TctC [Rhizobacter sp.]
MQMDANTTHRPVFGWMAMSTAVVATLALACGAASAQSWPTKPVRVVVPFPPGGGVDVMIRAVAVELSAKWGQPVIIDNRAGAGGNIGADMVAKAQPDGYTLLATINQTITSNRYLFRSLPYDPDHAFAPISLMVRSDQFLVATPSFPAKDLRGLVTLAKQGKSNISYASFGSGSQPNLVYELLKSREHLDMVHVPYKGVAPALTAVMSGEVQLSTASAGVGGSLMKAERIKPLAIAGKQRSPLFPDVPTTTEQGYPELQATTWYAVLGPAGMPKPVIDRIDADIRAVLKDAKFAEMQATSKGLDVVAGGPAELATAITEDVELTGRMVRTAGVKPE